MSMPPQPCLHIQSNQDDFSSVERSKQLQESFPLHQSNALEYKQKIKRIPMTALLRLTLLPQSENGHTTPNFLELGTPLKARSRKALVFRTHFWKWQPLSFQPWYIQLHSSTDMVYVVTIN